MFLLPHLGTIIWVSIIFGIVYFILSKYAWKPLIKTIEDREQTIAESLVNAETVKTKLLALEVAQEKIITLAKQEKAQIVKEGMEQREQIIAMANKKARTEADKIIENARKAIAREKEATLTEMKTQIASLSVEIATKVVQADMEDKVRHEKMVNTLISEIELN